MNRDPLMSMIRPAVVMATWLGQAMIVLLLALSLLTIRPAPANASVFWLERDGGDLYACMMVSFPDGHGGRLYMPMCMLISRATPSSPAPAPQTPQFMPAHIDKDAPQTGYGI